MAGHAPRCVRMAPYATRRTGSSAETFPRAPGVPTAGYPGYPRRRVAGRVAGTRTAVPGRQGGSCGEVTDGRLQAAARCEEVEAGPSPREADFQGLISNRSMELGSNSAVMGPALVPCGLGNRDRSSVTIRPCSTCGNTGQPYAPQYVPGSCPDLARIVATWHRLPEPIRRAIRALIHASGVEPPDAPKTCDRQPGGPGLADGLR
jgi:hypothetical protein